MDGPGPGATGSEAKRFAGLPSRENNCRPAHSKLTEWRATIEHRAMGFNRRKMEDGRREAAEKEAASRRATDAQVLEDAERLITAWNERSDIRGPLAI